MLMCKLTRGERFADARTVYNQHGSQSLSEVYKATGVAASLIKDLEDDQKERSVGYDKIAALAKHYGVSSDYLLGLSTYPTTNKDLEFLCNHTGLNEKSVKYLMSLLDLYNRPIEPSQAPEAAKRWLKGTEYYEKFYEDACISLRKQYSASDCPRREIADMWGVADENDIEAIAWAQTECKKRNLERTYDEEIEAYRKSLIVPIVTLNAILSCDGQKKILEDLANYIQMCGLKDAEQGLNISIDILDERGKRKMASELPVEAITTGYLKRAEASLSELYSEFSRESGYSPCSIRVTDTASRKYRNEVRKKHIAGYDKENDHGND